MYEVNRANKLLIILNGRPEAGQCDAKHLQICPCYLDKENADQFEAIN